MKHVLILIYLFASMGQLCLAQSKRNPVIKGKPVVSIHVRGNAKVESDAILTLLKTQVGRPIEPAVLQQDIRTLFELGYFADVRFLGQKKAKGIQVIIQVKEKPAITDISYEGMEEVSESDVKDKLETKLYTIVNEATIADDVQVIQKQYADKGFYLANVSYRLDKKGENEVHLVFQVDEGNKVKVNDVFVLGNEYFSDEDIITKLASRPYTRSQAFGSSAIFQDDMLKRDLEFIAYYYRDNGFAEVKVARAIKELGSDREFVTLTFKVEEGLQYNVGKISVSGDMLYPEQELIEEMRLKQGDLFRYSRFSRDIEKLGDKYGDKGYAYADINPKTKFNRDSRTVDINYVITKGEKVYFGNMIILGNTKTRDNVIRREFEVHDSELYSGTGMFNTKRNISRLGFFEEVQVIKERRAEQTNLMDLKVQVKEKPTGQLQAAVGFSPQTKADTKVFGQGRYDEQNQSGRGWKTNVTAKWNGGDNYSLDLGFTDPRLDDSRWSLGFNLFFTQEQRFHVEDDADVNEKRFGGSVTLGRRILEDLISHLRASATYRLQRIVLDSEAYLLPRFRDDGLSSSMIFRLTRNDTNNYLDPSEGSHIKLSQNFTGGDLLGGDHEYMESSLDAAYYLPFDFSDTYRTYFKFRGLISHIYPLANKPVPFQERYRLGGYNDLRGFPAFSVTPEIYTLTDPTGSPRSVRKGGDKKLLMQLEYFVPLLPEAGIKALLFGDMGRVYDDEESIAWAGFKKDVGFGFRWQTPIAPFRFEWAYPIEENGNLGDVEVIFYIGY